MDNYVLSVVVRILAIIGVLILCFGILSPNLLAVKVGSGIVLIALIIFFVMIQMVRKNNLQS